MMKKSFVNPSIEIRAFRTEKILLTDSQTVPTNKSIVETMINGSAPEGESVVSIANIEIN